MPESNKGDTWVKVYIDLAQQQQVLQFGIALEV